MADYCWGSLGRRQLHIRTLVPSCVTVWDGYQFRFSWRRALSPFRLIRSIFNRHHWSLWAKRWRGINHRCYCDSGSCIDGRIELAGYGVLFWYSNYTGKIPCWCDQALAEMQERD
jgi:hypothetical protein